MTIHPPKLISSIVGLGLPGNTKSIEYLRDGSAISTETCNSVAEPWKQGNMVIALHGYQWITKWEAGKPYIVNKFFNREGGLVGIYYDVSRPVRKIPGGFEFDDLYLDVWCLAANKIELLDEDELEAAVIAKYISPEEADTARGVAGQIVDLIQRGELPGF